MTDDVAPLPTLRIHALGVGYPIAGGTVAAVRGVSLTVGANECLGVVGESGSGKTQLFMAVMGLLPGGAQVAGSALFQDEEILGLPLDELNRIRGSKLAMVFQDPMTSLTPHLKIGVQLGEILVHHRGVSWRDAESAALRALDRVHIPDPQRRLKQYPHQLSGGMRQRVMIAMSLLCEPALVIADEPTSALDVSVQARILELLRDLRAETGISIVLISHDLAVVASLADRVVVMYAGRVVESAPTEDLMRKPLHPYSSLLDSMRTRSSAAASRAHAVRSRTGARRAATRIAAVRLRRAVPARRSAASPSVRRWSTWAQGRRLHVIIR